MLEKFLKKIGVNSYDELNSEEKATYREWEQALQGRKLTDKDVKNFLEDELSIAVTRVTEEGLSERVRDFRSAEVRIIKKIQNFLNSPKIEKEFAQKAIDQLTNIQ